MLFKVKEILMHSWGTKGETRRHYVEKLRLYSRN